MTQQATPARRTDSAISSRSGDSYLESIVQTASPARLRLMLIEKAIDVSSTLARTWREGGVHGPNEHSVKLLDLLNELLSGVVGGNRSDEKAVCGQVADLYVFLSQHLVAAESNSDSSAIDEITAVLHVEAETWRAVCAQESTQPAPTQSSGLNLQA